MFRPWLEQIVALKREEAAAIGHGDGVPYDALMDDYEPGAKTADVARVFSDLRRDLVELVQTIGNSSKRPDVSILERRYPKEAQRSFARGLPQRLVFDSTTAGSTSRRIRSARESGRATADSRRAMTRDISPVRFSGSCMKPGTESMSKGSERGLSGPPIGDAVCWASTNRNRGCGRTSSAAAAPSGRTLSGGPDGVPQRSGHGASTTSTPRSMTFVLR